MSERSGYEHGTPSWADLTCEDVDAAVEFYGGLFGWEASEPGPVEETGGYRMFSKDGKAVAGIGPKRDPSQPTVWMSYVTVDDADAAAAAAGEAGGGVVVEPIDVLTAGRMAVLTDAVGAAFAVWQPRESIGAELVNEPGSLTWTELASRDIEAPKAFYRSVFGWEAQTEEMEHGVVYTTWTLGGEGVAGMIQMDERWGDMPPHWTCYFAVADCDASAERARELGAEVAVEPTTIPAGRFSVIADPQGAYFSVIALAMPPR